ncbi:MAG: cyclodeaminase/cyclohydrolase family protein [Bacteroidaceae bacterium]|nr:cyclodeaminase/cyclohydrolase family protein [Bacteroidaceae bacterium]
MKLVDLNVTAFLDKTASNEPVPGGGSISALNAAIAAALGTMVTNLTIGRKKYADKDEDMKAAAEKLNAMRDRFVELIDLDSEAYDVVFAAFKLPKETEEEKAHRAAVIEEATKHAAEVPMEVARTALAAMPTILYIGQNGNANAITDSCVAMMCCRTAVRGALLNVRINLAGLNDEAYIERMKAEAVEIEAMALVHENDLITYAQENHGLC